MTYVVRVERAVDIRVRSSKTPKAVRERYAAAYREFRLRGCAAATYRLSGPEEYPRFCVRTLPENWRLVVDFPAPREVAFRILEPHTRASDPYLYLAELLGVTRAAGVGTGSKPSCCDDDGSPPPPSSLP